MLSRWSSYAVLVAGIVFQSCSSLTSDRDPSGDDWIAIDEMEKRLRFGSELTFSSQKLLESFPSNGNVVRVQTKLSESKVEEMHSELNKFYENADESARPTFSRKTHHSHWNRTAYEVTYPNDFRYTFFSDPGALEVNTAPSSLSDISENKALLQRDVFDQMDEIGLKPAAFTASGHIHIEVKHIDPVTFRNFIVDFSNHTGLAAGGLNEDIFNSVGMGEVPESNKKKFAEIVSGFDSQRRPKSKDLVRNIVGQVYSIPAGDDLPEYRENRSGRRPGKYFAISFESYHSLGTIEIRSIRPQASAESYEKLLKLFVARMKYAKHMADQGERIPVTSLKSVRGDPQAVLKQFDEYVTKVGLDFEDYKEFVMPWWQQPGGEFESYMATRKTTPMSCATKLKLAVR